MSALVALKLLVGVAALLWWAAAAVRSLGDFSYRSCQGGQSGLARVPQLFLASAVSGCVAAFLDAAQ